MTELTWQRSSFCGGGGNNCVEVASRDADVVIRSSAHPTESITFSRGEFAAFVAAIRSGELGLLME